VTNPRTSAGADPRARPLLHAAARFAPGLLLVAACFAAFLPCLGFDLLQAWDDPIYVLNNVEALRFSRANVARWFTAPFFANYHPLTMLTYMVDLRLWDLWGPGYHLQNLLWHTVAALGVYGLARALHLDPLGALTAALLWAIHPLRVESVVWVSERKDVICGAFYVWGLAWAARETKPPEHQTIPFFFFVFAVLGKAMAVSFPFVLLCLDWHKGGLERVRRRLRAFWPYAFVLGVWGPLTFFAQASEHGVRTHWNVLRQAGVAWSNLFRYAGMTAAPAALNPIYPLVRFEARTIAWIAAASAAAALGIALLWRFRRHFLLRTLAPAFAAYGLMLLPVSGIVPLGGIDYADRYTYLPTVPFFLLAGAAVIRLRVRFGRLRVLAATALAAIGLGLTTYWTCYTWQDIETLFGTAAAAADPNPVAAVAWAKCLIRLGRVHDALVVAEQGIRRHPGDPRFRFIRARCLARLGRKKEALKVYERLIGKLDDADFYAAVADCYRDTGAPNKAETFYSLALNVQRPNYNVRLNRGAVRFTLGKYAAAADDFRAAAAFRPERPEPLLNLARTLAAMGRMDRARQVLEKAQGRLRRVKPFPVGPASSTVSKSPE